MEINFSGIQTGKSGEQPEVENVLILGSGPAGLAAALYAARAELAPLVLTGMEMGGQAALTHTIENYPGFPDGVGGQELGELFQKQAERFGARIEFDTANVVDLSQHPFKISADGGNYFTKALIIATGARPNHLNVPGEVELTGKGVSYCATCDGWFFKDKRVVVVGGGDSALEEGIFLTRYASSVTIIHRRDTLRAGAVLQKRANENPKISFIWNSVIKEIQGTEKVTSVLVENLKTGEKQSLSADGVFIFIGHQPNTSMFKGQLAMDDAGYIQVNNKLQTSIPGVFACGEAADPTFRQVITSAGMGAGAAMQAVHFLENQ
ncbi:MAG TPA: thioredoxin-disulfide reductase [Anaerolineaceae bacterium]